MRLHLKNILIFLFFALICTLFSIFSMNLGKAIEDYIPSAVSFQDDFGTNVDFYDAMMSKNENGVSIAAVKNLESNVSYNGEQVDAVVMLADEKFGRYAANNFIYGGWYTHHATISKKRLAVISEELARNVFGTAFPVNKYILVDGIQYEICGVYEKSKHFFVEASENVLPVIYICWADSTDNVDILFAITEDTAKHTDIITKIAKKNIGKNIQGNTANYSDAIKLSNSLQYLALFFCSLYVIYHVFSLVCKLLVNSYNVFSQSRKKTFFSIVAASILVMLSLWVLVTVLAAINIPISFLPPDNIFDLAYYKNQIILFINGVNSISTSNIFSRRILWGLLQQSVLLTGAVVSFYIAASKLNSLIRPLYKPQTTHLHSK